ncbi:hypothetical protein DXG01_002157 [Tephrocybe rancida]|nr:hypothetical protein DXG01_002157 [Tephrocybe rancida]
MKYSQAVLVACVGASTLVSAAPTVVAGQADLPNTHTDSTIPHFRIGLVKTIPLFNKQKREFEHVLYEREETAPTPAPTPSEIPAETPATGATTDPAVDPAANAKKGGESDKGVKCKKGGKGGNRKKTKKLRKTKAVATREFDEELLTRAVEDELEARGFFSNLKANYQNRKAASGAPPIDPVAVREFDEYELDAREFDDELEARFSLGGIGRKFGGIFRHAPSVDVSQQQQPTTRDFDEYELDARDFDDELEARFGLGGIGRKLGGIFRHAPSVDVSQQQQQQQRDFDEYELDARDFDEYELDARDFDDELEARFSLGGIGRKLGGIFRHAPSVDVSQQQQQQQQRDLDEYELDARDFDDELEARFSLGGIGRKLGGIFHHAPSVDVSQQQQPTTRDFFDEYELDARDFEEYDLEARDFDLEERGIRNALGALKDTIFGKKPAPAADATYVRDFPDELDARDFEIDELD